MFENKGKKEKRFEYVFAESGGGSTYIYTDLKTGVQYLQILSGEGCGVTVLVDENGKPLIDEEYKKEI